MCLRFVLILLVRYRRPRLTSCSCSLTTFTCGALVLLSVGARRRMMSKASLGVPNKLKSGATALSLIIRSRFTTHSKRTQAGGASRAHRPNNRASPVPHSQSLIHAMEAGSGRKILIIEDESDVADL